jgi:hypothetical protein
LYLPDLAPEDFFLFRKVKEGLGGLIRSWLECCKKCIRLGGEFVEKS